MSMNAPVSSPSTGGGIASFFEDNPSLALGGIIVLLLIVGALVLKSKTPAATPPVDTSGTTPTAYVPTTTSYTTVNENSNNPTTNTGTTSTVQTAFVRGRYSSSQVMAYDKKNPSGVPIRATPGGLITGHAAYGSQVTINDKPATGKSNLPGSAGSTEWLPLKSGGYISAYDITGLSMGGGGGSIPISAPVRGGSLQSLLGHF